MADSQLLKDLNTLSSFMLRTPPKPDQYLAAYENHLEKVKDAAHRLYQHTHELWRESQEEDCAPGMRFQESQFFTRENHLDSVPDDHAFGTDTDLREARWQQQQRQPQPPEPDDWNSPRI